MLGQELPGGVEVDVVEPDARAADDAEPGAEVEGLEHRLGGLLLLLELLLLLDDAEDAGALLRLRLASHGLERALEVLDLSLGLLAVLLQPLLHLTV